MRSSSLGLVSDPSQEHMDRRSLPCLGMGADAVEVQPSIERSGLGLLPFVHKQVSTMLKFGLLSPWM